MAKKSVIFLALILTALLSAAVQAQGVITVQVEILPGFSISAQQTVVLEAVMPGERVEETLEIQVWSNVAWDLRVGYHGGTAAPGKLEVRDDRGVWHQLDAGTKVLMREQPETGAAGVLVQVPLRFTGGFSDAPDTYTFQIEFTLVPVL
ncbi:MAG: hypothetical protein WAO27_08605 [Limnochordia bacterium]|jgi:hypothetical protein|nr:hypothetical protein [Limnochordia bacterium]HPP72708.1 hypothetical protein [Limnochordia bacterium]HPZ79028.1 hypothetical protein [Limnochordia bacterium]HQE35715.1 hypothetical protein [Limnochordia bacterium]